jgi:hypothetical protein
MSPHNGIHPSFSAPSCGPGDPGCSVIYFYIIAEIELRVFFLSNEGTNKRVTKQNVLKWVSVHGWGHGQAGELPEELKVMRTASDDSNNLALKQLRNGYDSSV